jgi:hypothetical protein
MKCRLSDANIIISRISSISISIIGYMGIMVVGRK